MNRGRVRKHNIDMMFLMVLFLVFTFSAVSVLLMAVNSYRSVVYANEANSNARTAIAYIREEVRQHDNEGAISLSKIDGVDCIKMTVDEGYSLYIYEYDGYLMELEAKDDSGATLDFGNKILEVNNLTYKESESHNSIEVTLEDSLKNVQNVTIGIRSVEVESDEK